MEKPATQPVWQSTFITAEDGLKLHIRLAGNRAGRRLPVVCLAGLTRNSIDFEILGDRLAASGERWVVAPDYRGRGLSDYDPDWRKYDLKVELADLLTVLTALAVREAIFIGTSRGGLLTALLGMVKPGMIRGVVLNDIGPVIEAEGLARIRGYVGKIPPPKSYEDGAALLQRLFGAQFPLEDAQSWLRFAQRSWKIDEKGGFVPRYDRNLMRPLAELDLEKPMPDLRPQFDTLHHAPLLVIRGELSDLLSAKTAMEMVERHGSARFFEAAQQGHAPLLEDEASISRIIDFVESCDRAAAKAGSPG